MADEFSMFGMFHRYTMEARRVVFHARRVLSEVGGSVIDEAHLLHGLLSPDVRASRHFGGLLLTPAQLGERVRGLMQQGPVLADSVDVPMTSGAKSVLKAAWTRSKELGSPKVNSDHILLALVGVGGHCARLLAEVGLTEAAVRNGVTSEDPDVSE